MEKKKKILADHTLFKKKLITPMNKFMGNGVFHETPFILIALPEIIWQGILNKKLGVTEARRLSLDLLMSMEAEKGSKSLSFISNFSEVPPSTVEKCRYTFLKRDLLTIQIQLGFFIRLFPGCPLSVLFEEKPDAYTEEDISELKDILGPMLDRTSVESVNAIANTVYYNLETHRFTITKDSSLLELDEIKNYPNTERSKVIASSLRSTLNFFVGREEFIDRTGGWPGYFWNRCHEIEPCKISEL